MAFGAEREANDRLSVASEGEKLPIVQCDEMCPRAPTISGRICYRISGPAMRWCNQARAYVQ